MKLTATAAVAAPRAEVFAALNDREILRRSIPGCVELTGDTDEASYHVKLKLGIAGIKGHYAGTASHEQLSPHESFTLVFDGKGRTGWVRGTGFVRLTE